MVLWPFGVVSRLVFPTDNQLLLMFLALFPGTGMRRLLFVRGSAALDAFKVSAVAVTLQR